MEIDPRADVRISASFDAARQRLDRSQQRRAIIERRRDSADRSCPICVTRRLRRDPLFIPIEEFLS
jgi:hypothetical protein